VPSFDYSSVDSKSSLHNHVKVILHKDVSKLRDAILDILLDILLSLVSWQSIYSSFRSNGHSLKFQIISYNCRCILKMDHHCRIPIINFVWRILSLMAFSILFCCYPAFICNPFWLNVFFLLCGLLFYLFIVGLFEVIEMPVFNWGRVLSLGVDICNECTLLF
jgi:hypothetical protein